MAMIGLKPAPVQPWRTFRRLPLADELPGPIDCAGVAAGLACDPPQAPSKPATPTPASTTQVRSRPRRVSLSRRSRELPRPHVRKSSTSVTPSGPRVLAHDWPAYRLSP